MYHVFDTELAVRYGLVEAILLYNLKFWITKNKANGKQFYDGFYWTYNSVSAFSKLFPYVSRKRIQNALQHLIDEGVLQTGNYNELKFDKTLWYSFTRKGESIVQLGEIDYTEKANDYSEKENGDVQKGKPIPDSKQDNKQHIKNTYMFTPPTIEEVREYCQQRKNTIDAEYFCDYYQRQRWKLANGNKMSDWRAAVRTWERKERKVGVNGVVLSDEPIDPEFDRLF